MSKKRVHILSAVNAANISKAGGRYTIRDVCGAVDGIVMNGRLYPADQLAAAAPGLEGKPAPAGHPKNSAGQYISATNGEALLSAYIGSVCTNARHTAGRTLVDIVVNESQAKADLKGAALIERLDAAIAGTNTKPIHVSTGLNLTEVKASGESMGKPYTSIATNLQYDHLAILLNEKGAGTPEQGVGLFLNSAGQSEEIEEVSLIGNADTAAAEKKLRDAIALHEKHMDGTEPTTGADGEKSQMKMMKMMKAALAALVGKSDAKPAMAMNTSAPADMRHEGLTGWLRKLLGNESDLSFDQIADGLRALLPKDAYPREVFAKYFVWFDYASEKLYRQDYAVGSGGALTLTSDPAEVRREVEYKPVTNSQKDDPVKPKILAALNAAGIKTDALDDDQLLTAYNSLIAKPHTEALTAANSKLAALELAANAAADAELTALAQTLAVNTSLTPDDFKAMGLTRCKELAAAGKAAPVVVANSGATADEFAGYDINAHEGA